MRFEIMRRPWVGLIPLLALLLPMLPKSTAEAGPRIPTRVVSIPRTLADDARLVTGRGRVHLSFPATHIAFSWTGTEGTYVRYKIIPVDGEPTRWLEALDGGEHGSDGRHHSAVLSVPRSAAIRYKPVVPKGSRIGDLRLTYMNTLDGPRVESVVPIAPRAAAATTPTIVTRAEWGANENLKRTSGSCQRGFHPVQQLFVHHTAGSNSDGNGAATMRAIYQYHVGSRGWCDIGYNFVIGRDGTIYEARWARNYAPWETHSSEDVKGNAVSGAHVAGYNSGSVGISLMGNFEVGKVPTSMRESLVELLAWEADRHDLSPKAKHTYRNPDTGTTRNLPTIAGHRNAGQTSCPGRKLYKLLPDIRSAVAQRVGTGRPSTELTLATPVRKVTYGTEVSLDGILSFEDGTPLAGRTVVLHRKLGRGSRWFVETNPITSLDGSYDHTIEPERNTKLRAQFPDAPDAWGSQSRDLKVKVRHLATLGARGGVSDPSGTVVFPGGTSSVTLAGNGAPVHQAGTVKVHIWRVRPDGSTKKLSKTPVVLAGDGSYEHTFEVPGGSGTRTFTAVTWYSKDNGHLAGRSETLRFIIAG